MKVPKTIITFILVFILYSVYAQWEPQTVINQRNIDNGYISDADSNLTANEYEQLNQILHSVEKETGVQYGIVIVNEISPKWDVASFGVELFNLWGIGGAEKDKGLLLLIVMNTRDWHFFSGYGVESTLPDALLIRLGKRYIVPAFKDELYAKGLTDVSEKIYKVLSDMDEEKASGFFMKDEPWWDTFIIVLWFAWLTFMAGAFIKMREKKRKTGSSLTLYNPFKSVSGAPDQLLLIPNKPAKATIWAGDNVTKFLSVNFMAGIVPAMSTYYNDVLSNPVNNAFIGLYIYLLLLAVIVQYRLNKNAAQVSPDGPSRFLNTSAANKLMILRIIFFPFVFLPYYFIYRRNLNRLKDEKITCQQCHTDAFPLSADGYRNYLSEAELLENKLKSRDTRLYQCYNHHLTRILFAGKNAAAFRMCKACGTLTMAKTGEKTIQAATQTSKGEGQREFTCKNCGAIVFAPFVIPMLQRTSSGSGFGSSRPGGGSWGGGRTGGGGAGGKW